LQNETELTLIEDPRRITSTNDINYNLALLVQNEIQIVETSIYSPHLEKMKEFYVDKLSLEFVSEQR
jgi:hypothetical protein